jgi:hypothetical protein
MIPSHQFVSLHVYPSVVARQRLDEHVTLEINTLNNREIRRVAFYAVRVITEKVDD